MKEAKRKNNLRITTKDKEDLHDPYIPNTKPKKHKEVEYVDTPTRTEINYPEDDIEAESTGNNHWESEDDYSVQQDDYEDGENYWNSYAQEDDTYEDESEREASINKQLELLALLQMKQNCVGSVRYDSFRA
eukprot:TRINITY_DN12318_c0_g1_i2.p1 TRINITY_DN12318_c0_g1~~TRINITY_DN12318_c0_g1_i2.p1  ORF type:complete len:132 (-),score=30.70 TRINITY_DN12318_c0_g1_i2:161-556(-)